MYLKKQSVMEVFKSSFNTLAKYNKVKYKFTTVEIDDIFDQISNECTYEIEAIVYNAVYDKLRQLGVENI